MNSRAYRDRDHALVICLNLYGWPNQINALELYDEFKSISDDLDLAVDNVSYVTIEEALKVVNINLKTFEKRKLDKYMMLSILDLYRNKYPIKTGYNYPSCGVGVESIVDDRFCTNNFYLYFEPSRPRIDPEYFSSLIRRLFRYFKPTYGIGYLIEQRFVPAYYVSGFIEGRLEEVEQRRIGDWGSYYSDRWVPKAGELRDVYELNYLSDIHLNRPVGNVPGSPSLRDWISSTDAGSLSPINETLTLWELNTSRRDEIRQTLLKGGSLVATV